jgi:hypothetical protein
MALIGISTGGDGDSSFSSSSSDGFEDDGDGV